MPFGSEQQVLQTAWIRKVLWRLRGDFHLGRWARHFYIEKMIRKFSIEPRGILDAGCGKGQTSFFLERRFPNSAVCGVDNSAEDLAFCETVKKAVRSRVQFLKGDLTKEFPSGFYDLVILTNVLSAIRDYQTAFINIMKGLPDGGWLILQDMNLASLKERCGPRPAYEGQAHSGFYLEELSASMRSQGLEILCAAQTLGFFGDFAHRLFDCLRRSGFLLNVFFPLLKFLTYADTLFKIRKGSGLLVVGRKC
jgi:SAM-dependent methyltransferase